MAQEPGDEWSAWCGNHVTMAQEPGNGSLSLWRGSLVQGWPRTEEDAV